VTGTFNFTTLNLQCDIDQPTQCTADVLHLISEFGGIENLKGKKIAIKNAVSSGGSFTKTNSMAEAFKDADIVYPKSWAPFVAMEKRTDLYGQGDDAGIKALEKELLAQNAEHMDWQCTEELMKTTKNNSLYLILRIVFFISPPYLLITLVFLYLL
jgi:ornithine carbamoyltransferase